MSLATGVQILQTDRRLDSAAEHALIEQCRKNSFEAFGKIIDAYQSRVFGFVRRMTYNVEEALDITQEVFIRAYQGFGRFDGRCSLRTWLFRIAYNLCIDRSRKVDRTPNETHLDALTSEDEQFEIADSRWNPETAYMDAEFQGIVETAIESMSEKLRSVLLLHDREDMSYEEIADLLSIPLGTVKSRLFLARNHVQSYVNQYWSAEAAR